MKVSTKGRYALRIMIAMAAYNPEEFIPLRSLADSQGISEKYLEAIISPLVKSGFLTGQRGKGGGYKLALTPDQYTAGDILRVAEGSISPVSCLEGEQNTCPRAGECSTLNMWTGLDKVINEYLDGISLQDLVNQDAAAHGNYVI